VQALLSEHWHVVRALRPRLREGVEPLHRVLRGKPWVLLMDPATHRFHRLPPRAWRVVERLDGRHTLDEVWEGLCAQAESAPTGVELGTVSQQELVSLLSMLHANDLLQSQVSPDADEVFERYERQVSAQRKQRWLNPMSVKIPLLHPDPWFEAQKSLARRLFTWPALVLWLALVGTGFALGAPHWASLTENLSDQVLSASNLLLLWFTYPAVKAVHEWAHGMAVKAWGGRVQEVGLIFVVFTPVPYVDATSSYRFPSKWARATVAAAGIMAELALAALALFVWLMAEPGLARAVAFNVVLIATVSTVFINGNPLMRFDGYFVLCDLLELPNLAQRSTQYLTYLLDRYAYGSREAKPPVEAQGERLLLLVYGVVSPIYRLLITIGLIWFVAMEYLLVGALMALLAAWTALVMPLWKGFKHLRDSPTLAARRDSAYRRTWATLAALLGAVALLPMPFHSVHHGVVWLPDEAIVRAEAAGTVSTVAVAPDEMVTVARPLLALDSPTLLAEQGLALAGLDQIQAQLRRAEVLDPVRVEPLKVELASRQARLDEMQRRFDSLQVQSALAGRWVPAAHTELAGRYVKRGEVLGFVIPGPSRLVRAAVTQEDMDLIRSRLRETRVRFNHAPGEAHMAVLKRQVPGGEFDLVSAALGTQGGGEVAIDPTQRGARSLARVFDVEIELDQPSAISAFGDRAYVRFDLGPAPLGWQWFLRLRQLFLSRLSV
jgi:putative peptide zinc metalloprotease protein